MNFPWEQLGVIAALGALGGFAQCAHGGFRVPRYAKDAGRVDVGFLENIFVGALSASVVWCLYGPLASFDLAGGEIANMHMPLLQLASSVLVGFSGGEVLTRESQRRNLELANKEINAAKNDLARTLKDAVKDLEGE